MKDFPGGPVVENLPAKTGDMGTIPGLGRFHMPQGNWLSLCSRAWELQLLNLKCRESAALQQERPLR